MRVTMKLTAEERRRGVDLRDVLGGRRKKTVEPKNVKPKKTPEPTPEPTPEFRPIEYVSTELHDADRDAWVLGDGTPDGVRLYQMGGCYLQIRAWVKKKTGGRGKHFAISAALMSREDLTWLRDQINAALRRKR